MLLDTLYTGGDLAQWEKLYKHMCLSYPIGVCVDGQLVHVVTYQTTGRLYVQRVRECLASALMGKCVLCTMSDSKREVHAVASDAMEEMLLRV